MKESLVDAGGGLEIRIKRGENGSLEIGTSVGEQYVSMYKSLNYKIDEGMMVIHKPNQLILKTKEGEYSLI